MLALEEARELPEGAAVYAPVRGRVQVRVPGAQIGACKRAEGDVKPCILVEFFDDFEGGECYDRVLCHRIDFHGETRMKQSIGSPCPLTGAILWLESFAQVTMFGRETDG